MRLVNSRITGAPLELDVLLSDCVLRTGGGLVVGDAMVGMAIGIAVGVETGTLQPLDKNNNKLLI